VGVGSADDGLGDTKVPSGSGYSCSGTHRVKKDGSSGTITLGPFTVSATCPVSNWETDYEIIGESPLLSYEYHYWDWFGGTSDVSFGVAVVPPAKPVNFRCTNAYTEGDGVLHYEYAWNSSTGNLADLAETNCTIKERLSYEGNSTGYYSTDVNGTPCYVLPLPFEGVFADPEIYGNTAGTKGWEGDDHFPPRIPGPYQYGSYTATQYYIYTDNTMDPNDPNDYVVLRGPIEIDHTVWAPDNINWVYDIIKYDSPDALPGNYREARKVLGPASP